MILEWQTEAADTAPPILLACVPELLHRLCPMPSVLLQYICCTNSTKVVLNKRLQKYENRKSMEAQELSASIFYL